jgi:serine/threonine protein kinase
MSFREGQRLGHYNLDHVLGAGGMAVVWRAWDSKIGRQVAIKVVSDEFADNPAFTERFLDEIRRHRRLDHPRIVRIHDAFSFAGRICMVMDLITGRSLAALIEQTPQHRLPIHSAVAIMADVLAALDHAHRHGVLHRDVKPSNILLDGNNRAYLSDFGIALALGEERRTRTGVPVGTAEYMSPEQIRTPQHIDHRTDVYSAACVLYEMLTGRPPFIRSELKAGESDFAVRSAHMNSVPIPPRQRVPSIGTDIDALVMRGLRKVPDKRLPGCAEFSRLLVTAARGSATPVSGQTNRALPLAAGVGLLVMVIAVLLYVVAQ